MTATAKPATSAPATSAPATPTSQDWTKPAATAIPKEGYFKLEQGRYGPVYPKTPACYGFTIIAKIKPGPREGHSRVRQDRSRSIGALPTAWRCSGCTTCGGSSSTSAGDLLHVPGHLRHRLRQVHRGRRRALPQYGVTTVFVNLEGFPEDWKTNPPAFIEFVRDHQCPSFLEYGEYPYVGAEEIKKALKLKAAFSEMLDEMQ